VNWVQGLNLTRYPAGFQNRANRCGGVDVSIYYIGIYGEGKLEGKGCRSLKIQYKTVGKSVNIGNLGTQND
jgi:hypothetical protein